MRQEERMFFKKKNIEKQDVINAALMVYIGQFDEQIYNLKKQVDELRDDVDYLLESLEDYLD